MFSKDKFSKDKKEGARKARPSPPTIISPDVHVVGNITSDGEIQLDGIIEGDVKGVTLCIGHTGSVDGSVTAETTLVRGKVSGQITSKVVTLTASARVLGDVIHETLTIEAGARLEGHCRRIDTGTVEASINLVISDGTSNQG